MQHCKVGLSKSRDSDDNIDKDDDNDDDGGDESLMPSGLWWSAGAWDWKGLRPHKLNRITKQLG